MFQSKPRRGALFMICPSCHHLRARQYRRMEMPQRLGSRDVEAEGPFAPPTLNGSADKEAATGLVLCKVNTFFCFSRKKQQATSGRNASWVLGLFRSSNEAVASASRLPHTVSPVLPVPQCWCDHAAAIAVPASMWDCGVLISRNQWLSLAGLLFSRQELEMHGSEFLTLQQFGHGMLGLQSICLGHTSCLFLTTFPLTSHPVYIYVKAWMSPTNWKES
ncbi:hypothetical protein QBC45DRAFT_53266 [Copromyces sp. CBS 386.78]|nr:hypothetical protein QBC45DRAFT_53266 [Copromyces sp. CBS 386.78]